MTNPSVPVRRNTYGRIPVTVYVTMEVPLDEFLEEPTKPEPTESLVATLQRLRTVDDVRPSVRGGLEYEGQQ